MSRHILKFLETGCFFWKTLYLFGFSVEESILSIAIVSLFHLIPFCLLHMHLIDHIIWLLSQQSLDHCWFKVFIHLDSGPLKELGSNVEISTWVCWWSKLWHTYVHTYVCSRLFRWAWHLLRLYWRVKIDSVLFSNPLLQHDVVSTCRLPRWFHLYFNIFRSIVN